MRNLIKQYSVDEWIMAALLVTMTVYIFSLVQLNATTVHAVLVQVTVK